MDDEEWMLLALKKAQEALDAQEVAVGCVFLLDGSVVAESRNTVNETKNPSRHAELNCIDQVLKYCQSSNSTPSKIFSRIKVIVTVEPCIMCAEALHNVGVCEVVFGCKNDRFGGTTVFDLGTVRKPSYTQKGGVLADKAMDLLKKFYAGSNPNVPLQKKLKTRKKVQ